MLVASILNVDLDPFRHRVLVDKGAREGVFKGQAVLDAEGIFGQVAQVHAETAEVIGDTQVRNRGTLGGAVAHADPASDMPAVMLVLGAMHFFNLFNFDKMRRKGLRPEHVAHTPPPLPSTTPVRF